MTQPILDSKIVIALDYADAAQAINFAKKLDPQLCKLKVGKELFTTAGPQLVEKLVDLGFKVFLDLKFHDIPNTVSKACEAATRLGVWMLNVHASGGVPMMQAALEGVHRANASHSPLLIAVTVLTSMDEPTLQSMGVQNSLSEQVLRLARLTQQAGLDGVVCSAQEAAMLRQDFGQTFCLVTPGIRPANSNKDDQTRIVTPKQAITLGSSYLVVGRPITAAADPLVALTSILEEINEN